MTCNVFDAGGAAQHIFTAYDVNFRGGVRVYLNGVGRRGDPRRLPVRDGDEVVLEVGGFVPPHRSYRFPRR